MGAVEDRDMQDLWDKNECKNVANVYYEQDVDRSARNCGP